MKINKRTVFPERLYNKNYVEHIKRCDKQDVLSEVDFSDADLIKVNNTIYKDQSIPEVLVSNTEVKIMKMDKVKWELIEMVSEGKLDDYPHLKQLYDILKEEI